MEVRAMSMPELYGQQTEGAPNTNDILNQIAFSIALEEMGLAHILNAVGEGMQKLMETSGPLYNNCSDSDTPLAKPGDFADFNAEIRDLISAIGNIENSMACELYSTLINHTGVSYTITYPTLCGSIAPEEEPGGEE
jgi:hypothetical protein